VIPRVHSFKFDLPVFARVFGPIRSSNLLSFLQPDSREKKTTNRLPKSETNFSHANQTLDLSRDGIVVCFSRVLTDDQLPSVQTISTVAAFVRKEKKKKNLKSPTIE
jgi:hypothetical protein